MSHSQSSIEREKRIEKLKQFRLPIQTRDELLQRYARRLAGLKNVGLDERRWFSGVFNVFCTQSESTKFWSERDLADFMQSTFPSELSPILMDAIPIMHRCLLRLGSYPYQNDPEKLLTHNTLRTAIIWVNFLYNHTDDDGPFPYSLKVLAFESLASLNPGKNRNEEQRSEDNDQDLKEVLDELKPRRRDPDHPKLIYVGPPNPLPSHFRSSWSGDLDQTIPTGEFRSFLRLMIIFNPYNSGIEPACFSTCLAQVEKTADCLLAALQPSSNYGTLSWENFDQAAGYNMPYFFLGMTRLLGPLLCPKILPQGSLPSSVEETQGFFKKVYIPSKQRMVPSPGHIFNLPLLSQLGFMLPRWIIHEGMSVAWSSTISQMDLRDLRDHITRDLPMLLLVSGRSNQDQRHVTFGFFYPKGFLSKRFNEEIEARMLQLEPVQRYFTDFEKKVYSIQFDLEGEIPTMTGRVTWQDKPAPAKENSITPTEKPLIKHNVMNLTVNGKGLGHFMVQAHNLPEVDEHFDVDAVELVNSEK